jgi:hypothetical protein
MRRVLHKMTAETQPISAYSPSCLEKLFDKCWGMGDDGVGEFLHLLGGEVRVAARDHAPVDGARLRVCPRPSPSAPTRNPATGPVEVSRARWGPVPEQGRVRQGTGEPLHQSLRGGPILLAVVGIELRDGQRG